MLQSIPQQRFPPFPAFDFTSKRPKGLRSVRQTHLTVCHEFVGTYVYPCCFCVLDVDLMSNVVTSERITVRIEPLVDAVAAHDS